MLTNPRLAVLTRAGSPFGLAFLRRLAEAGVRPGLLCVEETRLSGRIALARRLAGRIGWPDALRYNLGFFRDPLLRALTGGRLCPLPDYAPLAGRLVVVRDINDPAVAAAVDAAGAGSVLLAQSGVVRGALLDRPGRWIVNSHPGRLPGYRGVDVVRWALLEGAPVEATLHRVECGIDTGPPLASLPVPVRPGDSWRAVERRALAVSLNLLVAAATFGPAGFPAGRPQAGPRAPLRRLMPFAVAARLEREWPALRAARLAEKGSVS